MKKAVFITNPTMNPIEYNHKNPIEYKYPWQRQGVLCDGRKIDLPFE